MKPVIIDIKDITYSREFLDSRPNPIISIFIYVLISILLAALIWSSIGELDIYIKTNGMVRPNEKVSTIRNYVTGKVEQVYYEEGKRVKKGDILYILEYGSLSLDRDIFEKQLEKAETELKNLKKFKQSISDNKNYFDENLDAEKEYYYKYLKFVTDQDLTIKQAKNTKLDMQQLAQNEKYSRDALIAQTSEVQEKIAKLKLLKQSIEQNKYLLPDKEDEYYVRYLDHTLAIQSNDMLLQQKKQAYEAAQSLYDIGAISEYEFENARDEYNNAEIGRKEYLNNQILEISSSIKQYEDSLRDLSTNLERSKQNYITYQSKELVDESTMEKYRLDTLVHTDEQIATLEVNIDSLNKNLIAAKINIENSTVTAPIDGTINVTSELNKGDLVQSGMEIATIIPDNDGEYKVQLYVSNKDIANLNEGQRIDYRFYALPYREYGSIEGKITKIGTDAKVNQDTGLSYYPVEAAVENKPLFSYKGTKAEIKVGMTLEAQVITDSKKILFWALEKMNLRD
ncbi:MAG: hypothetical protein A2Y23_14030 [Clostridiales bacterium GWB2_37_7]|nr:MAG: hypothetical protein A2Y23_14030 [Clostridiales bacterium GWB2_37_7]